MESLYNLLDDPSYNIYIISMDTNETDGTPPEALHWVLEIHPRFPADMGGMELASGIRVITGLPEDWAKEIRGAIEEVEEGRRLARAKPSSPDANPSCPE